MKVFSAALVTALVLMSAPGGAQVLDLSAFTCKQYTDGSKETAAMIYMWLEGYHTDEDDPAILDFDKMKVTSEKLRAYCEQNPSVGLLTAADKILDDD